MLAARVRGLRRRPCRRHCRHAALGLSVQRKNAENGAQKRRNVESCTKRRNKRSSGLIFVLTGLWRFSLVGQSKQVAGSAVEVPTKGDQRVEFDPASLALAVLHQTILAYAGRLCDFFGRDNPPFGCYLAP